MDDGLGYYDDGVKRTLTDEQVKMFRHSEIQELLSEWRLQREERAYEKERYESDEPAGNEQRAPRSPQSDASSIEGELVGLAGSLSAPTTGTSRSTRSATSHSSRRSRYKRKAEVPYYERHKRKWEHYIEDNDPIEGSRTHRRLVREMDDLATETLDVDYGDETTSKEKLQRPDAVLAPSGRRMVAYDDD